MLRFIRENVFPEALEIKQGLDELLQNSEAVLNGPTSEIDVHRTRVSDLEQALRSVYDSGTEFSADCLMAELKELMQSISSSNSEFRGTKTVLGPQFRTVGGVEMLLTCAKPKAWDIPIALVGVSHAEGGLSAITILQHLVDCLFEINESCSHAQKATEVLDGFTAFCGSRDVGDFLERVYGEQQQLREAGEDPIAQFMRKLDELEWDLVDATFGSQDAR